jgi:hypothetical protein
MQAPSTACCPQWSSRLCFCSSSLHGVTDAWGSISGCASEAGIPAFFALPSCRAVALPVFAMAGFAGGAREIRQRTADPAARQALLERKGASTEEQMVADALWEGNVSAGAYTAFLILVFGARSVHHWLRKRQRTIRIVYADGTEVLVFSGNHRFERKPPGRNSSRRHVRRPRQMLHVPGPHHGGSIQSARANGYRAARACACRSGA